MHCLSILQEKIGGKVTTKCSFLLYRPPWNMLKASGGVGLSKRKYSDWQLKAFPWNAKSQVVANMHGPERLNVWMKSWSMAIQCVSGAVEFSFHVMLFRCLNLFLQKSNSIFIGTKSVHGWSHCEQTNSRTLSNAVQIIKYNDSKILKNGRVWQSGSN